MTKIKVSRILCYHSEKKYRRALYINMINSEESWTDRLEETEFVCGQSSPWTRRIKETLLGLHVKGLLWISQFNLIFLM